MTNKSMDPNNYYDLAFYIPATVTLARVKEILDDLGDMEVEVDYDTMEFLEQGLCFMSEYDSRSCSYEDIETYCKNGDLIVDWDTMADWMDGDD